MTLRDCGTVIRWLGRIGDDRCVGGLLILVHIVHQLVHRFAGVVTCDVVVQIFPETFDPFVVWTIGWQEVELNPVSPASSGKLAARLEWMRKLSSTR